MTAPLTCLTQIALLALCAVSGCGPHVIPAQTMVRMEAAYDRTDRATARAVEAASNAEAAAQRANEAAARAERATR